MILSRHTFVRAISFDDERLRRSFKYVIGIEYNSASIDLIKKRIATRPEEIYDAKGENGVLRVSRITPVKPVVGFLFVGAMQVGS